MTESTQSLFPGTLRQEIEQLVKKSPHGIAFSDFMRLALYHSNEGYYAKPRRIGREGDFFTSVSVGPCFGMLLARQIHAIWEKWQRPNDFQVVEQGAHDGQLAEDILENLTSVKYTIIEPNPAYREAQNRRFDVGAIQHQVVAEDFSAKTGVFLCNELLDAFPVDRYRVQNGEWHEIRVVLDENGKFADQLAPNPSEIDPGKPAIDLPEGFEAEFCPGFECWLSGVFNLVEKGIFLLIDYGFSDSELFDPARSRGTLRCFRNHEATENPYEHLGETDLTAHVNFTRVMALAESTGFDILGFTDQNRFLTGIAADWLQEIEQENEGKPTASHLVRQFQTLTHPGSMGRNFRVLVLGKNAGSLTLDGLRFG